MRSRCLRTDAKKRTASFRLVVIDGAIDEGEGLSGAMMCGVLEGFGSKTDILIWIVRTTGFTGNLANNLRPD